MAGDAGTTLMELRDMARKFTDERDWEQFHRPKDLAMAIAIEAAELQEPFLWKHLEAGEVREDGDMMAKVREELADILILSMSLANTLDIDLATAYREKMELNDEKYPVEKVKGRADKYTAYQG